jgi:hypothetical protein
MYAALPAAISGTPINAADRCKPNDRRRISPKAWMKMLRACRCDHRSSWLQRGKFELGKRHQRRGPSGRRKHRGDGGGDDAGNAAIIPSGGRVTVGLRPSAKALPRSSRYLGSRSRIPVPPAAMHALEQHCPRFWQHVPARRPERCFATVTCGGQKPQIPCVTRVQPVPTCSREVGASRAEKIDQCSHRVVLMATFLQVAWLLHPRPRLSPNE